MYRLRKFVRVLSSGGREPWTEFVPNDKYVRRTSVDRDGVIPVRLLLPKAM